MTLYTLQSNPKNSSLLFLPSAVPLSWCRVSLRDLSLSAASLAELGRTVQLYPSPNF